MNITNISWTHRSVNPLKMMLPDGTLVNVCIHKSEGCRNCYAEFLVKRWWKKQIHGEFPGYTAALLKLGKPVIVEKELKAVIRLDQKIAAGKVDKNENRLFWNDMTDEYLDYWPDELIDQCWAIRALTPNIIHQVLTKRPDRAHHYFKNRFTRHIAAAQASKFTGKYDGATGTCDSAVCNAEFPYPNVWLGVSVEDQKTADERIPVLLQIPAALYWISAEPLLGLGLELRKARSKPYFRRSWLEYNARINPLPCPQWAYNRLGWVVVGGESGARHREMNMTNCMSVIEQCWGSGVPVFVKQDSGPRPGLQGRIPDEYWVHQFPKGVKSLRRFL